MWPVVLVHDQSCLLVIVARAAPQASRPYFTTFACIGQEAICAIPAINSSGRARALRCFPIVVGRRNQTARAVPLKYRSQSPGGHGFGVLDKAVRIPKAAMPANRPEAASEGIVFARRRRSPDSFRISPGATILESSTRSCGFTKRPCQHPNPNGQRGNRLPTGRRSPASSMISQNRSSPPPQDVALGLLVRDFCIRPAHQRT